jgi:hypothetical protein
LGERVDASVALFLSSPPPLRGWVTAAAIAKAVGRGVIL